MPPWEILMTRGSVWWVAFDPSIGSEIQKTRPAVILSNNYANAILSRVIVVPMTSNIRKVYHGNAIVTLSGRFSRVMTDQIRVVDKSRLKNKIGVLSPGDVKKVEIALSSYLELV